MPDPIWLDTSTVARIANGDPALEGELQAYRKKGHKLLLVPAADKELLYGNMLKMKDGRMVTAQQPSEASRRHIENVKYRLGISVDMEGAKIPRERRVGYAMQEHVTRPKNQAVPSSLSNISESDSLVLSQIKASAEARGVKNPIMITAETGQKAMVSQAHLYGVKSISTRNIPAPTGGGGGTGGTPPPSGGSTGGGTPPAAGGGSSSSGRSTSGSASTGAGTSSKAARTLIKFGATVYRSAHVRQAVIGAAGFALSKWWADSKLTDLFAKLDSTQVPAAVEKLRDDIAATQLLGDTAYANVKITVITGSASDGDANMPLTLAMPPSLTLKDVTITSRNINEHRSESIHSEAGATYSHMDFQTFVYSFEVSVYTSEQIERFNTLSEQYMRYNRLLLMDVGNVSLRRMRQDVREALVDEFGEKSWVLQAVAATDPFQ